MAKKKGAQKTLTKADIEKFRTLLLEKYNEIMYNVVSMENETLRREQTDLSKVPLHLGDAGSDTFEIDNTLGLVDSERKLLEEIIDALERIEQGSYGICLGSGKPIGKARLTAIPWAKYCIEYANLLDRGLVAPDDTDNDTYEDIDIDTDDESDIDDDTDHTDKTAA
jgi:RNA polymerase-binding protein DksA